MLKDLEVVESFGGNATHEGIVGGVVDGVVDGVKSEIRNSILYACELFKIYIIQIIQLMVIAYIVYEAVKLMFGRGDENCLTGIYLSIIGYIIIRMFWKLVLNY